MTNATARCNKPREAIYLPIHLGIPFPSQARGCTSSWSVPALCRDPLFRFAEEVERKQAIVSFVDFISVYLVGQAEIKQRAHATLIVPSKHLPWSVME